MNTGSTSSVAWNVSRHAPSWAAHLHCGSESSSSPDIICTICHHVCHYSSAQGNRSMGNHSLAKEHITSFHELTELEVTELTSTMITEIAVAIMKRQGSR